MLAPAKEIIRFQLRPVREDFAKVQPAAAVGKFRYLRVLGIKAGDTDTAQVTAVEYFDKMVVFKFSGIIQAATNRMIYTIFAPFVINCADCYHNSKDLELCARASDQASPDGIS